MRGVQNNYNIHMEFGYDNNSPMMTVTAVVVDVEPVVVAGQAVFAGLRRCLFLPALMLLDFLHSMCASLVLLLQEFLMVTRHWFDADGAG